MNIRVEGVTLQTLRKRYKASIEGASRMTGVEPEVLREWEAHGAELSITDAKKLAKSFHSHWSVFLLKTKVQSIEEPINHRAGYANNTSFSSETLRAYEIARKLIDASIEIEGQTIDPALTAIQHAGKAGEAPISIAKKIRQIMDVDTSDIQKIKGGPYEVYKFWKQRVSALGVYISEQNMPEDETKAFLLKDGDRAVIVVNKNDRYIYSRIFSLMHELGHLVKGEDSAACKISVYASRSSNEETWCNRFASELVASDEDVTSDNLSMLVKTSNDPASIIKKLSSKYKTSFTVILYKLKKHDKVTDRQCAEMQSFFDNILLPQLKPKKDPKKEIRLGRAYYVGRDVAKASTGLSREVVEKQMAGNLSYSEAARLLNTKARYLEDIKIAVGFGQ